MSKDSGGPAFPWGGDMMGGMDLRDYMAIHATDRDIEAVMSKHYVPAVNEPGYWSRGTYSITCQQARYIHADAMITERAK